MRKKLLESINDEITTTVIDKISNYLGESREKTGQAITAIIPSVLAMLSKNSSNQNDGDNIYKLSSDAGLTELFQENTFTEVYEKNRDSLMLQGNSMLISLFGDKETVLSKGIADYADISKESVDGILAAVVPLILSVIGRDAAQQNLNATDYPTYFSNQNENIYSEIPVGLNALMTKLGLERSKFKSVDNRPYQKTESTNVSSEIEKERRTRFDEDDDENDDDEPVGYMKWVLPLLGILAALALLWLLMKQCQDENITPQDTITDTIGVNQHDRSGEYWLGGTYDSINNRFLYDVGTNREIQLADGEILNVGDNSVEWKLHNFIIDESYSVSEDKTQDWFTLDRVYFETGSNNLTSESQDQINNIVAILKANPDVRVKFGGYTDNSGSDDVNIPLSAERASVIMNQVIDAGIDFSRLESEGYGSQHPVCTENDTAECMSKNRRVDIRVTAK